MRDAAGNFCEDVGMVITPTLARIVERAARKALSGMEDVPMGALRRSLTYPSPPYAHRCSFCGDELPPAARFCIACGRALAATGQTERIATTGATERLDDDALYVTSAEYDELLSDPDTHIVSPFLSYERIAFFRGRKVIIRDE